MPDKICGFYSSRLKQREIQKLVLWRPQQWRLPVLADLDCFGRCRTHDKITCTNGTKAIPLLISWKSTSVSLVLHIMFEFEEIISALTCFLLTAHTILKLSRQGYLWFLVALQAIRLSCNESKSCNINQELADGSRSLVLKLRQPAFSWVGHLHPWETGWWWTPLLPCGIGKHLLHSVFYLYKYYCTAF